MSSGGMFIALVAIMGLVLYLIACLSGESEDKDMTPLQKRARKKSDNLIDEGLKLLEKLSVELRSKAPPEPKLIAERIKEARQMIYEGAQWLKDVTDELDKVETIDEHS